jgi:uncharacterized iron-regulated protein
VQQVYYHWQVIQPNTPSINIDKSYYAHIEKIFIENDILIFGDHHRSRPQHTTFAKILRYLKSKSNDFVVYLEIPQSEQQNMDSVIFGSKEYTDIFYNYTILKDYGYETIVNTCKRYKIPVVCFDKGFENRNFKQREEQMADMLINDPRKIITMVGGSHLPKSDHTNLYESKSVKYIQMWDIFRNGFEKFESLFTHLQHSIERPKPLIIKPESDYDYDYNLVIPFDKNLYNPCEI